MLELYNKGNYFKLYVLGFEFAESEYQEDLDWVNIEIDVKYNSTTWTARGAYLTINEISKIETWFSHISNFSIKKDRLDFFENEIAFEFNKSQNILSII